MKTRFLCAALAAILSAPSALAQVVTLTTPCSGAQGMTIFNGLGANSATTATLPPVYAKTNYLTGFEVTALGATAGQLSTVTITGLVGGSVVYDVAIPTGATLGATPLIASFIPPIPASAPNVAINVIMSAAGAGNTNQSVIAHGCAQ